MMSRLMTWLEKEASWSALLGYAILAGVMIVSLQQAMDAALVNWGIIASAAGEPENPFAMGRFEFLSIVVMAPIMEELFFRLLPLSIVIGLVSKKPWIVFGFTAAFAILFGAIHPYSLGGKISIMIGGFFFGLVFMKCGGLDKKFPKATVAAMTTHAATNLLVLGHEWWSYQIYHEIVKSL